jgi:hypothetical protein
MRKGSQSLLPNSNSAILMPMAGGLQVRWHEELDSHVLYHGENRVAAHHNGFSCHELAKRMLAGDTERTLAQFDYITACGGKHYMTREAFLALN